MAVSVIILHNIDPDHFTGYQPGHHLTPVWYHEWSREDQAKCSSSDTDDDSIKAQVWDIANVGDDPELAASEADPDRSLALSYRHKPGLDDIGSVRSLSVGDVLVITDVPCRAYSVESIGWQCRALADLRVVVKSEPGSPFDFDAFDAWHALTRTHKLASAAWERDAGH